MRIIGRSLVAVLVTGILSSAAPAYAGWTTAGTVTAIHAQQAGIMLVYFSGTQASHPGCASVGNRYAFDASTTNGQAWLALLTTVMISHASVTIEGTTNCPHVGDTESIWGLVVDPA